MHFSKTYTELLLSLPPELRNNAIEYRKLKKLINQVVQELTQLGFSPDVLQQVLLESKPREGGSMDAKGKGRASEVDGPPASSSIDSSWRPVTSSQDAATGLPRVVYEINTDSDKLEPRLRLLVNTPLSSPVEPDHQEDDQAKVIPLPILSQLEEEYEDIPTPDTPELQEDRAGTEAEHTLPRVHGSPAFPGLSQGEDANTDNVAAGVSGPETGATGENELFVQEPIAYISSSASSLSLSSSPSPSNLSLHLDRHGAVSHPLHSQEVIIPLPSDTAFFQLLMQALQTLSTQLGAVADEFIENLHALSRSIASTARPISATSHSFTGHSSFGTHPATVRVQTPSSLVPFRGGKSDLYQWREIFQMYMDLEVFECHNERTRGERSVEDAEERLALFKQRLSQRGYLGGRALRIAESRQALDKFVQLNVFILDLKKFQFATTEATRKILKKHAKRTALPVSPSLSSLLTIQNTSTLHNASDPSSAVMLTNRPGTSLSQMLVQAVGEMILPIVPHIDDYACVICTSIAFKPIRLQCRHLFCVRCLVKMQKRGKGSCPMCRAPTVLQADRSNVDWALLNFMKDWFPIEAREKLQQSEREAAEEQMKELGFKTDAPTCTIM